MPIELPELPWPVNALEPHISAETLEYHHGKHHKAYVDKLNRLIEGTELAGLPLETIVLKSQGAVFEQAAQAWNHAFYWNSLRPRSGSEPRGTLARLIEAGWGDLARFKDAFTRVAGATFGSSWVWLVQRADGSLGIVATQNAATPITGNDRPLLVIDLWEHAYYIDHRNARGKYIDAFWALANWEFASSNLR